MVAWIFNCRKVARILSESLDHELRLDQRIGLRMHLLMCRLCSESRRQMIFIRKMMRHHAEDPERTESPAPLSAAARTRIKRALRQK